MTDDTPTVLPLHGSPTARGLLNFLKTEMDAGRMAAVSIVAVNQEERVFKEILVVEAGVDRYVFLGAVEAAQQDLYNLLFCTEEEE